MCCSYARKQGRFGKVWGWMILLIEHVRLIMLVMQCWSIYFSCQNKNYVLWVIRKPALELETVAAPELEPPPVPGNGALGQRTSHGDPCD